MTKRAAKQTSDGRRAVLYARVSGDDRHREGRNLGGQIDMGRQFATQRGYAVVAELSEDDRGASGASWELPQLTRALDMARNREYDVLIVREVDRLSRDLGKQLTVERELKRAGVRIEYVLYDFPDTPEGNFMKHVRASVAELERAQIAERMHRGMMLKVKSGSVMLHRKPIFGYRIIDIGPNKKGLEIVEEEAVVVRMCFQWCAYGDENGEPVSFLGMTRRLAEMRIPSVADRKARAEYEAMVARAAADGSEVAGEAPIPAYRWPRSSVARMMDEPAYMGEWQYQAATGPITVPVPAIVDRGTWERAQERRDWNRKNYRQQAKFSYLLRGMLTCGECGRVMIAQTTHPAKRTVERYPNTMRDMRYYQCRAQIQGEWKRPCTVSTHFRAEHVEEAIWEWVRGFLLDEAKLRQGLADLARNREEQVKPLQERLDAIDSLLAENRAEMAITVDEHLQARAKGRKTLQDILEQKLGQYEDTIASLERQRAEATAKIGGQALTAERMEEIQAFAAEIREGVLKAEGSANSIERRRRVLLALSTRGTVRILENGQRVVDVECELGSERLPISTTRQLSNNSSGARSPDTGSSCT